MENKKVKKHLGVSGWIKARRIEKHIRQEWDKCAADPEWVKAFNERVSAAVNERLKNQKKQ